MPVVIRAPRIFRINLFHYYDALTPVLDHPKRRYIFIYFITKALSNLGFNIGIMYERIYLTVEQKNLDQIKYLIKEDINYLFLGVYSNHNVVIRPHSDFIYDITIY